MRQYDTALRAVMWLDAFLSAALAVLCVCAGPLVAAVGVPHRAVQGLGVTAIAVALLLAGLGAVTGVLLMRRMAAGDYELPERLHLPLPEVMRPPT